MSLALPISRPLIDVGPPAFWLDYTNGQTTGMSTTRSTGAFIEDGDGNLIWRPANFPAIGTGKGLLGWEGFDNLLIKSEEFGAGDWGKSQASVSENATTAPDGTITADHFTEDGTASSVHRLEQNKAVSGQLQYTITVFFKDDGSGRWGVVNAYNVNGSAVPNSTDTIGYFDIPNGVKGTIGSAVDSSTIKALKDGWYRCSITWTTGVGGGTAAIAYELSDGDNNHIYDGDGSSGIYIWGAQLNPGSVAAPYHPTTTAAATRDADVYQVNNLDWHNRGELTILTEVETDYTDSRKYFEFYLQSDSTNNRFSFDAVSSSSYRITGAGFGGGAPNSSFGTQVTGRQRFALSFSPDAITVALNGEIIRNPTDNGALPSVDTLRLATYRTGNEQLNGYMRLFGAWNWAMPDRIVDLSRFP